MSSYLYLVAGLVILIVGAEFLVKGASEIALRLRISRLVVGLTIVAFGTSAPELFISAKSALQGHPELSVGNVVGSNICNITLVLGLTALIFPITVTVESLKVNWTVAMLVSVLFFVLVIDRYVNWYEGVGFLILISAYNVYLIRGSRRENKAKDDDEDDGVRKPFAFTTILRDVAFILLGSVALVYGSDWLVIGATEVAESLEVPHRIIAITVVAFGTSLPELATSIVSAFRRKADLGLGNLIGSNIFNILSIMGITAVLKEVHVTDLFVQHDIIWMLLITLVLFPVMLTRMRISRWEGLILLALYSIYMYSLNAPEPLFHIDQL